MNYNFSGQLVVVTGGTGGIGRCIIELFYDHGAEILMIGRNKDKLNRIMKLFPSKVHFEICDLSNADQFSGLISSIEEKYGPISVLICNAGIYSDNYVVRMKNEQWQKVIDINLNASFYLNREVIKKMLPRRYGKIVNISSMIGERGNIGQSNYSASKAAIIAMTKCLAQEIGRRGINVNCIAPGYINTNMIANISKEIKESIIEKIPLKRIGNPEEIGYAALFLTSNYSSYITGQTIHINGGLFML